MLNNLDEMINYYNSGREFQAAVESIKLPLSNDGLQMLTQKIQSELRPTLRAEDLDNFNLTRIMQTLEKVSQQL